MEGILVDDPGWNGKVVGFDWEAYHRIGREPVRATEEEQEVVRTIQEAEIAEKRRRYHARRIMELRK